MWVIESFTGRIRLSDIFQSTAFSMDLWQGIDKGIFSPLQMVFADVRVDLRGISVRAGDFDSAELGSLLEANMNPIARAIQQHVGERQTLVFTPSIASSRMMADQLRSLGMRAEQVSCECEDRAAKIAGYKAGETQVLTNPLLLAKGFDNPTTSAVVLCRPTKSRGTLMQMIGRATRLAEGKQDGLILDFNWAAKRGDLASLLEDEVKPKEGWKPPLGVVFDVAAARERARLTAIAKAAAERQEAIVMREWNLRLDAGSIDVGLLGLDGNDLSADGMPATPRQLDAVQRLLRLQFCPTGLTAADANAITRTVAERRIRNLATYRQLCVVKRFLPYLDRRRLSQMTFYEASTVLNKRLGVKRPAGAIAK
jgi:hypothetical protein